MSLFGGEVVTVPIILDSGLIVLPDAVECPACHRLVRLVSNKSGDTLCVVCDDEAVKAALRTSAPEPR